MIKRKKEAKKEKRVAIWKTEGVFHIPTRQTNNNNYYLSLKTKTLHCPAKPSHLTTLEKIEGFISIERFQSYTNPEKVLSLSFWKDEESIKEWRSLEMHRYAQTKGRESIFKDYRLRIADVARDYGMFDRIQAPPDSKAFHDHD